MNLKKLAERAKRVMDDRGGSEALKEDAQELRDIARGRGSLTDKARQAADALKQPGAEGPDRPAADRPAGRPGPTP